MSQVAENLKAWVGSFSGGKSSPPPTCRTRSKFIPEWTSSPLSQRKAHVEVLIEGLEHRDAEIRFTNARRLLYVLQGLCASSRSPASEC